ncbi:hypothetical protein CsSME_00028558 [Camellia sinensis var. sinensis]
MEGDLLPLLAMVIVQVGYAGMNILSKLAMDSGMNPFIHVAYRQVFATIVIAPFAYFLERITMNQVLYLVGLHNSTPTIACALTNLLPAVTFILAVPFGLESVGIKRKAGQAKILGTVVCVGGAMLLSLYHGRTVIGRSSIHWKYAENIRKETSTNHPNNFILGPFLIIASTVSWAIWFIIQARMSEKYAAPYTTSTLICLMASIQCGIIGFCANHNISAWSLTPGIRAFSSIYGGIVCTAGAFCLMSWLFNPLLLVIVAILSWGLLEEKLYVGTVVGSGLIVMALYAVLWGKNKEMNAKNNAEEDREEEKQETEFIGHIYMLSSSEFSMLNGIADLAKKIIETRRDKVYPLVYLLLTLALILPVATATVERVFSAMNIVKNRLRNRMGDELMNDSLVVYIERDIFDGIDNNTIMERFQKMKTRWGQL